MNWIIHILIFYSEDIVIPNCNKILYDLVEERNSQEDSWQNTSVSFKASWPTGLLIEPIIGTEPDNPFYIRQCYTKKYGNVNGVHEVCRRFLRNGTILKYLDDGKIIVLRPNGVIVTCTSFEKLPFDEYEDHQDDTNFQKGQHADSFISLKIIIYFSTFNIL